MTTHKILYAASEAHPLLKTGGLGDVAGALPTALHATGTEVRLIMPGYRDALARAGEVSIVHAGLPGFSREVRLLQGRLPGSELTVWFVDCPPLFDRPGHPYLGPDGKDWPDNAERYALFARAVLLVARDQAGLHWQPDVVHCNDWQCGLIPALLAPYRPRPATVFTIHNLAYQGVFSMATFHRLELPPTLSAMDGLEFYGQISFIKGGLTFADRITTVSPTYAQEIRATTLGCGLDGLLNYRGERVSGILNGIDDHEWNPHTDPLITQTYDAHTLALKARNKKALQRKLKLPVKDVPLLGMVSRLVEQKGVDLVLEILPRLLKHKLQIVVLGSGDIRYERALQHAMTQAPTQLHAVIGFDEPLAHLIEAGADIFLMPSRFEPCGLNQMYSLRYGTVPLVRHTGGLADTVVDATPENIAARRATGVMFETPSADALEAAVERALALHADQPTWRQLQATGMAQDLGWPTRAQEYLTLYARAIEDAATCA